jgi:hypothetical protein
MQGHVSPTGKEQDLELLRAKFQALYATRDEYNQREKSFRETYKQSPEYPVSGSRASLSLKFHSERVKVNKLAKQCSILENEINHMIDPLVNKYGRDRIAEIKQPKETEQLVRDIIHARNESNMNGRQLFCVSTASDLKGIQNDTGVKTFDPKKFIAQIEHDEYCCSRGRTRGIEPDPRENTGLMFDVKNSVLLVDRAAELSKETLRKIDRIAEEYNIKAVACGQQQEQIADSSIKQIPQSEIYSHNTLNVADAVQHLAAGLKEVNKIAKEIVNKHKVENTQGQSNRQSRRPS